MSKAMVKIDASQVDAFELATEESLSAAIPAAGMGKVAHAIKVAQAIQSMRDAMPKDMIRAVLQPLAGSPLGFQMDRDSYPDDVIRDCAIEAVLNGLPLCGNRWNIIGGRFYPRKEGFEDLCSTRCRFTTSVSVGTLPANAYNTGEYVTCTVTIMYLMNELPDGMEPQKHVGRYRVKLNKKSSIPEDLLEGKAKRKALRDLWRILSGIALPEGDSATDENGGKPAQSFLPTMPAEKADQPAETIDPATSQEVDHLDAEDAAFEAHREAELAAAKDAE